MTQWVTGCLVINTVAFLFYSFPLPQTKITDDDNFGKAFHTSCKALRMYAFLSLCTHRTMELQKKKSPKNCLSLN